MACSRGCWLAAQVVARFGACTLRMRSPMAGSSCRTPSSLPKESVGTALVPETLGVAAGGVGSLACRSAKRGTVDEYVRATKRGRIDARAVKRRLQDIILGGLSPGDGGIKTELREVEELNNRRGVVWWSPTACRLRCLRRSCGFLPRHFWCFQLLCLHFHPSLHHVCSRGWKAGKDHVVAATHYEGMCSWKFDPRDLCLMSL